MPKMEKTSIEASFDALANMNLGKYTNEWILLIDNEVVKHSASEEELLKIAQEQYSDVTPCIVKISKKKEIISM